MLDRLPSYKRRDTGESHVWMAGGVLAMSLCIVIGLVAYILSAALPAFWPKPIQLLVQDDGRPVLGQEIDRVDTGTRYRVGNRAATGNGFAILEAATVAHPRPPGVLLVEREEWGELLGVPLRLVEHIRPAEGPQQAIQLIQGIVQLRNGADRDSASGDSFVQRLDAARIQWNRLGLQQALEAFSTSERLYIRTSQRTNWTQGDSTANEDAEQAIVVYDADSNLLSACKRVVGLGLHLKARAASTREQLGIIDREVLRLSTSYSSALLDAVPAPRDQEFGFPVFRSQMDEIASLRYEQSLVRELRQVLAAERPQLADSNGSWTTDLEQTLDDRLARLTSRLAESDSRLSAFLERLSGHSQALALLADEISVRYSQIVMRRKQLGRELAAVNSDMARFELIVASTEQQTGQLPVSVSNLPSGLLGSAEVGDRIGALDLPQDLLMGMEQPGDAFVASVWSDQWRVVCVPEATHPAGLPGSLLVRVLPDDSARIVSMETHVIPLADLVSAVDVNDLDSWGKAVVYLGRWHQFLWSVPQHGGFEGGMFPAIWGTVVLTLLMTVAVVPLGVIGALYLCEYTNRGTTVSLVRVAISNLAGVPSIIYGVFGFVFFCQVIGAFIDAGPQASGIGSLPAPIWFAGLAVTAITGTAAFAATFLSSRASGAGSGWYPRLTLLLWIMSLGGMIVLVMKSPFFAGFFSQNLPDPTFGKGGILWAALTLALLTLPIVIVSTEEALVAVPNSLRIGAAACGASKWQVIRTIVLPRAKAGIVTGAILAMSRALGQVAPLMLVGALPAAGDLPVDGQFPYVHLSRGFMHLGYQIYTLGVRGSDTVASQPIVFACILLLLSVIVTLNLSAHFLRSRVSKRRLAE